MANGRLGSNSIIKADRINQSLFRWPIFTLIFGVIWARATYGNGDDFEVFYRVGKYLLKGEKIYDLGRDGGLIFKYPPWTAVVFAPFALLPLSIAKISWGILQALSVTLSGVFLERCRLVTFFDYFITVICFWGVLIIHAQMGQVSCLMTAVALMAGLSVRPWVRGIAAYLLTLKIFSVFPGVFWEKVFKANEAVKSIGWGIGISALGLLAAWPSVQAHGGFLPMILDWRRAAMSQGSLLDIANLRGQMNPGITPLIAGWLDLNPMDPGLDVQLALYGFMAALFLYSSQIRFYQNHRLIWIGALAIVPFFHPLPWRHLWVMALPMAAVAFSKAEGRQKWLAWVGILGFSLSRGLLGDAGKWLENHGSRVFAALLLFWVFNQVAKKKGLSV